MIQTDIQKLNLEIYSYIDGENIFKYDLKSELCQSGTYLVTADLIKIIKLLEKVNIAFQVDSNKFIKIK